MENIKIISKLTDKKKKLKLVTVTKNRSVKEINNLIEKFKIKRVAENRLSEAIEKFFQLPSELEKHYIGKLQSRKIKEIVHHFDWIQSLENINQAQKIALAAKSESKLPYPVLLQINLSGVETRSGCSLDKAKELIMKINKIPELSLQGVMGMASNTNDQSLIEKEFRALKSLQGDLKECSMGMSSDYKTAIQYGSTMLRLGSILFKEPLPDLPEFD